MNRTASNRSKAASGTSAKQAWVSPAVRTVAAREAEANSNGVVGSDGSFYS